MTFALVFSEEVGLSDRKGLSRNQCCGATFVFRRRVNFTVREGLKPEPRCEGSYHFSIPASSFLGPRCIVAMYSEVLILSFISAALVLVPLTWYLYARNIAAVAIGIWLSGTNLIHAVDALVWAEDADIKASVWCDICKLISTSTAHPLC